MDWYNSNRSQKLFCIKKNVDPDILLLNSNNIYCEIFCNFCNKAHFNEFKPLVLCVFFLQLLNFYLFTRSPRAFGTTRANACLRLTAYVPTDTLWLECTWEDCGWHCWRLVWVLWGEYILPLYILFFTPSQVSRTESKQTSQRDTVCKLAVTTLK